MLEWFLDNKEILKIFFGLVAGLICAIIVLRTDRLFRLSLHKGIRYFRNAFLFFGIAFIIRYFLGALVNFKIVDGILFSWTKITFEFFMVMGGFFLLYSLLWKKIENANESYTSSLVNMKILVFYLLTAIIVLLDYLWGTYYFLFFSQIILFLFASIISFANYLKDGRKHKFLKFYFIAMLLSLTAWVLNTITALYLEWNHSAMIYVYAINSFIFILFLLGVIYVTKNKE